MAEAGGLLPRAGSRAGEWRRKRPAAIPGSKKECSLEINTVCCGNALNGGLCLEIRGYFIWMERNSENSIGVESNVLVGGHSEMR